MKQFILVLVLTLIFISSAEIIRPATDQCTCEKIKSQVDCKAISSCKWTSAIPATPTTAAIPGSCRIPKTSTTPNGASAYCPQVTEPATNCWKTLGCAYVDNQCILFTGCTAYVKFTNSDCQAISKYCITDGSQCINAKSCQDYLTETACKKNVSISGNLNCQWDKSCRDYICTDADSTLDTDATCNAWLSGCVTTGKGCIATLGSCASYIGDDAACSGLKGTDGYCQGTPGGTNCNAIDCNKAAATIMTDADCKAYQMGCITTGKGCVASPLPTCSTYQGDNTSCIGYNGSDGVCEGDAGGINCRSRICTNAPASYNTEFLCSAYKLGCVTTGKGCDTSRSACGGYSGTIYSCIGYIGSDGYCQGTNDTISSPCTAKVCNDAPTTTSTDQACGQYQIGCKTTGKGCTSSLGRCSSYSGTTTTCEGYIGKDKKCKGTLADTDGPCTPKICNEAPLSIVTNEACGQYQTGCVTNGSGCIPQLSCLDTIKKISCEGTPGCGWNNICVSSQYCSDFNTVSICEGNNSKAISGSTGSNIPCHWTGTYCRNLACTDAPVTHNNDNLCNLFLAGCLTNGKGCLSPSASCSQYFGDRKACSEFTKKCWNLENASLTSACNERVCTDDTNSIADSACDSFKTGCRTKGQGCIDPQMPCSSYSGMQWQCDAFKGNYGQTRCWALSTTSSSSCLDKSCAHLTFAYSDADCEILLSGCLYNGAGCVPRSSSCGSYIGTQSQCGNFKGTNQTKICWSTNAYITGRCFEKECHHAPATTITNADCEQFLTGCLTNGQGCVPASTPCSSYFGTITECERFVGNQLPCYNKDACADKVCSDKLNPNNDADCQNYFSTCRYLNGSCVDAGPCYFYSGTSLAQCQDILDIANTKCWWTSGSSCISRTCSTVPDTVTNQAGCDSHILNCVYAGLGTCVPKGVCNGYRANGTTSADKLNNCLGMIDINGKYCCYTNGESCESKTCWNVPGTITGIGSCNAHVTGCIYNGTTCVIMGSCSSYSIMTMTNSITNQAIRTQCQSMKDFDGKPCWYVDYAVNCSSRNCNSATTIMPTSQANCDSHSVGCKFSQSCTRKVCSGMTNATNNNDCTQWMGSCRYIGGRSCVDSAPLCNYNIDISVTLSEVKQSLCQAITDNSSGKCEYSGTAQACQPRTCNGIIRAHSQNDCIAWMLDCRWLGYGHCEPSQPCQFYNVDATISPPICNSITNSSGGACQEMWPGSSQCQDRNCNGKTNAQSQADCTAWMPDCRWLGYGYCGPSQPTCQYYNVDQTISPPICNSITNSSGGACQEMWPGSSQCQDRNCNGKTNAQSQADCTAWMPDCRWLGYGQCMPSQPTCQYYNVDQTISPPICNSITNSSGGACQEMWPGSSQCQDRNCKGKTNAQSQADCTAWMPDCRWLGYGQCMPSQPTCQYYYVDQTISPPICNSITNSSGGACQEMWPGSSQCQDRNCKGKTNAQSQADCTAWMPDCRWLGYGQCMPSQPTCQYYYVDQTISPPICNSITNSSGGACQEMWPDRCQDRNCYWKTNAQSQADCTAWMPDCRWRGYGQCMPSLPTCFDYYNVDQTISPPICNSITNSSGGACQEMWPGSDRCYDRNCYGKTNAQSQADCTAWMPDCRWLGYGQCMPSQPTCQYYNVDQTISPPICNSITNSSGGACQEMWPGSSQCQDRNCNGKTNAQSQADCTAWMPDCRWLGASTACVNSQLLCEYTITQSLSMKEKTTLCTSITNTFGAGCQESVTSGKCETRTCAKKQRAISQEDCTTWLAGCKWLGGNNCVALGACSTYMISNSQDNITQITSCLELTDELANPCMPAPPLCEERNCSNILNPTSNQNCIDWLSTCRFTGTYCVTEGSCQSYHVSAGSDLANRTICEGIKNASGVHCAYVNTQTTCSERYCPLVSTVDQSTCIAWLGTSCRWDGTQCLAGGACDSYTAVGGTDQLKKDYCKALTDTSDPPLPCDWGFGSLCTYKDCLNVSPVPTKNQDCLAYLPSCRLTYTSPLSCIPKSSSCSQYVGTTAQCKTFKGVNDTIPCWSTAVESAPAASCIDKQCNHNTTATTNGECNVFLPNCKTNGLGCVTSSTPCSTFEGNASTCASRLSSDGINFCKVTTPVSDSCTVKKCYDDEESTTDDQCQAFMSNCVTRGKGCVPKTEPCSIYKGTQAICSTFTGNLKKCWNTASAEGSTFCVDKKCSDDHNSTTDDACKSSLNGCVTKGTGCIEDSALCQAYQGTQAICELFKGNKNTFCWNISTATSTTPCIEKSCSHNTSAISDSDCEAFLPRAANATIPKCVTSGNGCVDYPRACSGFTGTLEQCSRFTATDGPCKTTVKGSIAASGTCTPRICTEASNSYNTDALCQAFHPSCVTNGYGCASSVTCSMIQQENSCSAKTGCLWVSNCRSIEVDCSSLTQQGPSICINTLVSSGSRKCSWSYNACRTTACEDLPATLTTHDQCKSIISTCTTTGSGCITMTDCRAYVTEIICKAAKTNNIGNTCIWDTTICRERQCTDALLGTTTDVGCDTYLAGCKTNGISCVANLTCQSLLTADACQVDGNGKPCLYINGLCYDFTMCEDIAMTTHSACQQFSPHCTTNGDKCIAITTCSNTVLQISCVLGTDGTCGWAAAYETFPAKCQKFEVCSDSQGTNNASCFAYGSNCITDGINCVEKSTCSTYHTQIACENGGTDGICQFFSNFCRLRECTDATVENNHGGITTHFGCQGFMARTKCVTNGTSCIAEQVCALYLGEIECVLGTDGICVYHLETKACRVKTCEDFKFATNAACSVAIHGVQLGNECVSDGRKCIAKATCSSYTSQQACNGGGQDGLCAFTPGSVNTGNIGICKLMSACSDANQDWQACNKNSQACDWQIFTLDSTITTKCNPHTCATKAQGKICLPVPSFDVKTYTICGPTLTGCTEVAGNTLEQTTCLSYTLKTFTWDETTAQCKACFSSIDDEVESITIHGSIMSIFAALIILAMLVV